MRFSVPPWWPLCYFSAKANPGDENGMGWQAAEYHLHHFDKEISEGRPGIISIIYEDYCWVNWDNGAGFCPLLRIPAPLVTVDRLHSSQWQWFELCLCTLLTRRVFGRKLVQCRACWAI